MPLPPYPTGAPADVYFRYDVNGVVDRTGHKLVGTMEIERRANKTK